MAKKQIKEKSIEEALWESANKLRGSVEPSEYKHVVLSLIFLKYANDRFTERRNELVAADTFHNDQHKDLKADFIMANPPFNQKAWRAENELKSLFEKLGYKL